MFNFLADVDWRFLLILLLVVMGFLLGASYIGACIGAKRLLKFHDWLLPWERNKEKDHDPH